MVRKPDWSHGMRFAILGLFHETNTFSNVPADYAQFEASEIDRGENAIEHTPFLSIAADQV